jgi:hypothetical protein
MNIFYLSHDPRVCAQEHLDKHAVKMILEYCQLLSTAHRVLDGTHDYEISKGRRIQRWRHPRAENLLYKATHINHPSAIWARASDSNYIWLSTLLIELCAEYTYRYGKVHKCQSDGLVDWLAGNLPRNIPSHEFTQPTPAMPDQYKVAGDSIQSYRNYYIYDKIRMAAWKHRNPPDWWMWAPHLQTN